MAKQSNISLWVGTGGREPSLNRAGVARRQGGKQESQGGGTREKLRKILQHFVIFCNRNGTKRRELLQKGREAGVKFLGSGS